MRLLVLAACLVPALALAEAPPARPLRDVDVTYRVPVPDTKGATLLQRYRWSAATQTQRVDLVSSGDWMVLDFKAHRMVMVHEAKHELVVMPAPPEADRQADPSAYTRAGTDMVDGFACTVWRTVDTRGAETLTCTTADGVLLRATSGGTVMMEAASVLYAVQDPALFQPPAGYAHQQASP